MSTVVENSILTDAEADIDTPNVPRGFELIDGTLVETIVSAESSWTGGQIFRLLGNYAGETGAGWAFPADTGCQCFKGLPKTVRKPDALFVKAGRMGWDQVGEGYLRIAPDLVIEVNSPNDLVEHLEMKIELFRKAGTRLFWIVSPSARTVRVLRADGSALTLGEGDQLSGEDIIPGFSVPVSSIFPPKPTASLPEGTPDA